MVGMYLDLRYTSMNIIINKCVHSLFIVTLMVFQIFINLATELCFLQIIKKTRQMFGKLDIAVFYPLYGEFNIWDNDVSVCFTPLVTHKFGISNINCHKKLIRYFIYIYVYHIFPGQAPMGTRSSSTNNRGGR